MKRRSFFATVIGGTCAALWPWKAQTDEVQTVSVPAQPTCGDEGVWIYSYPQNKPEAEAEMMKLASNRTDGRTIILLPNASHALTIEHIPPQGKVSIRNGT